MSTSARISSDAQIIGAGIERARLARIAPPDPRDRTFYANASPLTVGLYIGPLFVANDVIVVGVVHKLRVGTATVRVYFHDDEAANVAFDVTTTRTVESLTPEQMFADEPIRLGIDAVGGGAIDLAFGLVFDSVA